MITSKDVNDEEMIMIGAVCVVLNQNIYTNSNPISQTITYIMQILEISRFNDYYDYYYLCSSKAKIAIVQQQQ